MKKALPMLAVTLIIAIPVMAQPLTFERQFISKNTFEASSAFDVNNDGTMDIVSGGFWYEGPSFTKSHKMLDVMPMGDYFDDFSDIPMDVNGDGWVDIITGGYWGESLRWRENPKGQLVPWTEHVIAKMSSIERSDCADMDGDGQIEIVPNCPGGPVVIYKLTAPGVFTSMAVSEKPAGHGQGLGDVNGDGRMDVVVTNGWYEQPAEGLAGKWIHHEDFTLPGAPSVPILVKDVNGDGLNDLIVGQSHDYGLSWWAQGKDAAGKSTWTEHVIDAKRSQYHDLRLVDIDNDGQDEVVTGKRYRAHGEADPGSLDPVGVYYFEINGGDFQRVTLDYGNASNHSGVGIYFWVADLDGDGWKDIVAPGKEGLYVFHNKGPLTP